MDWQTLGLGAGAGLVLGLAIGFLAFRRAGQPTPAPIAPPKPTKPSGEPLRLLALLQREARLFDFLQEDIQAYPDAQVGIAVKDIHRKCRDVFKDSLVVEPVMNQPEEAQVSIPGGFDPSAIRLTGNVTGK